MEAVIRDLADPLVHASWCTGGQPAAKRNGDPVVEVPDNHAVTNHWVDIHGVEEGDLTDIQGESGFGGCVWAEYW